MKKTYTIVIEDTDKGTQMTRTNDGFSPVELLGILEMVKDEVLDQIRGQIKPDIIKREVIED
jgi:hypothetical protein